MKLAINIWLWNCAFILALLLVPLVMGVPAPLDWPFYMKLIYGAAFMSILARIMRLW